MKKLNLTIQCMAVYNSSIDVPDEMGIDEAIEYIEREGIEFVDIRFCDLPGVMQHFSIPVSAFDKENLTDGLMYETAIYSMKKTATLDKTWLLWVGKDKAHCSSY